MECWPTNCIKINCHQQWNSNENIQCFKELKAAEETDTQFTLALDWFNSVLDKLPFLFFTKRKVLFWQNLSIYRNERLGLHAVVWTDVICSLDFLGCNNTKRLGLDLELCSIWKLEDKQVLETKANQRKVKMRWNDAVGIGKLSLMKRTASAVTLHLQSDSFTS